MTDPIHTPIDINRRIGIIGTGSSVPDKIVTNFDLETRLDTSDEWIFTRTGIKERRIASPTESTASLAVLASQRAIEDAGIRPSDIGLVVVATCTPDLPMPSVATLVQREVGIPAGAGFDINAACAGFAYALEVGYQLIRSQHVKYALIIGSEVMSRTLDWTDRSTAVLFGDAAGAIVLGDVEAGGILNSWLGADSSGIQHLYIPGGGFESAEAQEGKARAMIMNGREVYKFAVQIMGEAAINALIPCDLTCKDIDLLIPHQANIRIIKSAAERLELPMDRVFVNVDRYGNTSAASVPLALDEASRTGRIKTGDLIVTVGFGAGLTWGANVIRWSM